jgi:cytochrome c oxidase cbb3-type subunit 3
MNGMGRFRSITMMAYAATLLAVSGCSSEKRAVGPAVPQTPPNGTNDPRAALYKANAYQLSQGSRYFTWYGCGQCHHAGARGALDLGDGRWSFGGRFDQIYTSIAQGRSPDMPAYAATIPGEQLWQITGYVWSQSQTEPEKLQRQANDAAGEPQATHWSGPVK